MDPLSTQIVLPGLTLFIFETSQQASVWVADQISPHLSPSSSKKTVLGLATGSTPIKLYAELVKRYKSNEISFKHIVSFNLDEYALESSHPLSYHAYMQENLFNHVDIPKEAINIPDGALLKHGSEQEIEKHAHNYDAKIEQEGGIEVQILGIGRTGHIGFNEPGSKVDSTTRRIEIHLVTRQDAIREFGSLEQVPESAVTMGVGSILKARRIILMAFGSSKAEIISRLFEEDLLLQPTHQLPASFLFQHQNVQIVLDREAAKLLPPPLAL